MPQALPLGSAVALMGTASQGSVVGPVTACSLSLMGSGEAECKWALGRFPRLTVSVCRSKEEKVVGGEDPSRGLCVLQQRQKGESGARKEAALLFGRESARGLGLGVPSKAHPRVKQPRWGGKGARAPLADC